MGVPSLTRTQYVASSLGNDILPGNVVLKGSLWTVFSYNSSLWVKEYQSGLYYSLMTVPNQYKVTIALNSSLQQKLSVFWIWCIRSGILTVTEVEPFLTDPPTLSDPITLPGVFTSLSVDVKSGENIKVVFLNASQEVMFRVYSYPWFMTTEVTGFWENSRLPSFDSTSIGSTLNVAYLKTSSPPNVYEDLYDLGIDFIGTPTVGPANLSVAFTDTTPGIASSWSWDFGDGGSSTLQDPTHVYTIAGTYTVTLSVNGGAITRTRTDYISVGLVADFIGAPTTGTTPFLVQFNDSSRGTPTAWAWNFGDGAVSTQRNPAHIYSTPGIYDVTLTVSRAPLIAAVTKTAYVVAVSGEGIATVDIGLPPEVAAVVVARATRQTRVVAAPGRGALVSAFNVSGTGGESEAVEAGFKRLNGPSITLG